MAASKVMGGINSVHASYVCTNCTVKASTFYTENTNILIQKCSGMLRLNPPNLLVSQFAYKLIDGDFDQPMLLVNSTTETRWFAQLTKIASAVVFLTGRTYFDLVDGASRTMVIDDIVIPLDITVIYYRWTI